MRPVTILSMPHNHRCMLYAEDVVDEDLEGYAPICTEFVDLPIPMPERVSVTTDADGKAIAIWLDTHKWVRKQDVATVMLGIAQYNRDLATRDDEPAAGN